MADADSEPSTLPEVAVASSPAATKAFAILANETRLAILLALWERHEPGIEDNAVPFSELYRSVDYDNPGNFSYHLEKLTGPFVRKVGDEGYELRHTGLQLVQTVIAGAGVEDVSLEPAEIDRDCYLCGAPTAVAYDDGRLYQHCTECAGIMLGEGTPEGFLNGMALDPAGIVDRSPSELFAAAGVAAYRHMRTMLEGLCSACSGRVEASLDVCADHDPEGHCDTCGRRDGIWAEFRCRICKDFHATTPDMLALFHPAVVSFYHDHGLTVQFHADEFESIERVVDLVTDHHEIALESTDPARATVTVDYDGEQMALTYDETVSVVDVRRQA